MKSPSPCIYLSGARTVIISAGQKIKHFKDSCKHDAYNRSFWMITWYFGARSVVLCFEVRYILPGDFVREWKSKWNSTENICYLMAILVYIYGVHAILMLLRPWKVLRALGRPRKTFFERMHNCTWSSRILIKNDKKRLAHIWLFGRLFHAIRRFKQYLYFSQQFFGCFGDCDKRDGEHRWAMSKMGLGGWKCTVVHTRMGRYRRDESGLGLKG